MIGQTRHHRQQERADRERWRDEMRRGAYTSFLAATRQLNAAWWKVADELAAQDSTPAEWHAALLKTHDAWAEFSTASSAVAVAGPRPAAIAAAEVHQAMREWDLIGVAWARAAIRGGDAHVGDHLARFDTAASAKRTPLITFQQAARDALQTEH
ncbi:hypothetical protein [Streptomyces sp. NBC_00140]|uniref:hypothetical protein n=1 Tax=Streptomyces sp. NBC_00140 TaxID=2975664 RepID=UPI002255993B|nr:hypothetical protein [Streptomyces sp. NBC_00140]MCX5336865.1 hypothetical protein [Streptomyces sp. NBC_00140]